MGTINRREFTKTLAAGAILGALPSAMSGQNAANATEKDIPAPGEVRLEKGQRIIFEGDSSTNRRIEKTPDTWPYLRLMHWDKCWPDLMAEMLFCWRPELNLTFFNGAFGGSTCRDLAARLETNVLARKPQWVIATAAGNDARLQIPIEEYRKTMTTYAKRIIGEAGAQVLFFGISDPKAATFPARRAYYEVLAGIAAEIKGVHFADIGPRLVAKENHLKEQYEGHTIHADGGHFNAVGHTIIAGEFLRVFGVVN